MKQSALLINVYR